MGKAHLVVRTVSARARRGVLEFAGLKWPCALGRGGVAARKREGDGATPRGRFRVLQIFYRSDKFAILPCAVPLMAIKPQMGWCDAPADANYNRRVRHPYGASAERLWREDGLYDAVAVLDYNVRPRVRGKGSAIFLHVAREGFAPTEGCVALKARDLRILLSRLKPGTRLIVP